MVVAFTEMSQTDQQQRPKVARLRWFWFALALLAVPDTPGAVIDAVHLAQADHRFVVLTVLVLITRLGWICLFLRLWWKDRPTQLKALASPSAQPESPLDSERMNASS
jgi:uncharacterized membrane protein